MSYSWVWMCAFYLIRQVVRLLVQGFRPLQNIFYQRKTK
jgi:hypothetical protein